MKTYEEIKHFYEEYKHSFDKCNLTPSILFDLQDHGKITVTVTTKDKNYKVVSEEKENISFNYFINTISGISFFNDRVTKGYTKFGYIVTELRCCSPSKRIRKVRVFKYDC